MASLSGHFLDVVAGLPTLRRSVGRRPSRRMAGSPSLPRATMGLRISFLLVGPRAARDDLRGGRRGVVGVRLLDGDLGAADRAHGAGAGARGLPAPRAVGRQFHAAAEGIDAAEQVFAILGTDPAITGSRTEIPAGDVVVDDVTVTYPGADVVSLAPMRRER